MEVLLILTSGAVNLLCFFIGAKLGQTVSRGETIKTPEINPFKAYRSHTARKKAEKEKTRIELLMHNIDVYDGTAKGQSEIPRR